MNIEHIGSFVNLLKRGGKFIFDYSPAMSGYTQHDEDLSIKTVTHYSSQMQDTFNPSIKVQKRATYKIMPNPENLSPDLYQCLKHYQLIIKKHAHKPSKSLHRRRKYKY